jgi:hypothetical protein
MAVSLGYGQNFSAAITGTVRDASGAVIPQATVSARHVETGQTRVTETGANGNYNLPALPVGPYELTVAKPGFRQLVRRGINLVVAQEAVINLMLEIGQVAQTVEVTGEAPLVNTTLAATSGLINEEQIKDLPLNGRSFHQLMTLNANTVDSRANTTSGRDPSFSVAGKRLEANRWTMNGVDYVGNNSTGQFVAPNGISGQLLGVEAVREFNVLGHTYGAEYGKRSGGQITAVTMSGTNQLHGSAYHFLRNSVLDARNYFDEEVAPLKRNQFGGSLGGPIVRDKMFVFGNYEGFRGRVGESSNEFVPNAQARQGRMPCYIATPAAGACADPAAYVTVPNLASGILPYAQQFWPDPNGGDQFVDGLPTGVARALSNPVQKTQEDFGLGRFDYNVSNSDSLSANFTADQGESLDPDTNPLFITTETRELYTLSVQETHIFSPTVLNVATFGHTRARAQEQSVGINPIPESLVFVRGETRNSPGAITIGGSASANQASTIVAPQPQNPVYGARQYYSGSNDLSVTRGRHNLKMGAWLQRVQQTGFSAGQNNAGTAVYPTLLSFLQDQPTSFIFSSDPTELNFRQMAGAWYFQDELKLRPNLTVRLGLRHEMTNGWNERDGRAANYDYTNRVINTDPFIGESALLENNAKKLFQPRVGVAWDPTGTGSWAVRAGFGIHHDLQDSLVHRLNANPPFAGRITIEGRPLLSLVPITGGAAPPSCTATGVPAGCVTYSPGGIDPIMHTPTVQEWSLTVERQIAGDFMLQVGYVGSQSYHVTTGVDMNTIRPAICEDPAGCRSGGRLSSSQRATVPQGTEYVPVGGRPNPFVGSTQTWMYLGTASHHAGNISLLKRARGGLTFKTNYTWAKVLDLDSGILNSSANNEPPTVLNPYDLGRSKGIASYSVAHVFNTSFSYQLPFGSGRAIGGGATGWVEKVIGGWQWNGIMAWQGGFPITPTVGTNRSGNGDARNPDTPNRNPNFQGDVIQGVDGFKKDPDGRYFNPEAFLLPTAGTFGSISRGAFRGPGLFNVDTSFFKQIPLSEQWGLQFRAEFFNILNHANFDTPAPIVFSGNSIAPSAGTITETIPGNERQIQFALKLTF